MIHGTVRIVSCGPKAFNTSKMTYVWRFIQVIRKRCLHMCSFVLICAYSVNSLFSIEFKFTIYREFRSSVLWFVFFNYVSRSSSFRVFSHYLFCFGEKAKRARRTDHRKSQVREPFKEAWRRCWNGYPPPPRKWFQMELSIYIYIKIYIYIYIYIYLYTYNILYIIYILYI